MYDAREKQQILVVAPVMLIMADNPMSSDLCNHQGSSARKFCRFCLVHTQLAYVLLGLPTILMNFTD
ncbi:hypothetical protein SPONN_136 [uncultured Candidatus Thioglobus sp.]|nr:hypothetical protein SPONN_136 [uncultured Candidatus Thioglobus sp.]